MKDINYSVMLEQEPEFKDYVATVTLALLDNNSLSAMFAMYDSGVTKKQAISMLGFMKKLGDSQE